MDFSPIVLTNERSVDRMKWEEKNKEGKGCTIVSIEDNTKSIKRKRWDRYGKENEAEHYFALPYAVEARKQKVKEPFSRIKNQLSRIG